MNKFCLGTVQFGLDYGISNDIGKPKKKEVRNIIKYAINNNINFFDTAQSYGNSEETLGVIFKDLGVQNEVNIVSKLSPNIKKNQVYQSITKSLKNLKLNSLWGLLLHRYDPRFINHEFRNIIDDLKKEKIISNFGVSIYNPDDAIEAVNDNIYDIIQVPFNIIDRRLIDNDFFKIANKKNKKIFIRSIYLQGLLLMDDFDLIKKKMNWAIPMISNLRKYIDSNNIELKSFAFKAVDNHVSNVFLITGVDSLNQLKENLQIFNKKNHSHEIYENWWSNLKLYPDKLLNPSLW